MADSPEDPFARKPQALVEAPADETPLQRALRLKKAAYQAKTKAPNAGQRKLERAAAAKASAKSKPWMSR
ncbi:MAG TPA: hypothetical protein VF459_02625 [Caulobacteraceae bacterium]